jgi:hypothetical protein
MIVYTAQHRLACAEQGVNLSGISDRANICPNFLFRMCSQGDINFCGSEPRKATADWKSRRSCRGLGGHYTLT